MSANATVVSNFAFQHLSASALFRDQAIALESTAGNTPSSQTVDEVRSYVSGCVMSAAAGMEALINEVFLEPSSGLRSRIPDFEARFWGEGGIETQPILKKYQVALKSLGAAQLDPSTLEYSDARALIALRNALVHFKPSWDANPVPRRDLPQELAGRFTLSPWYGPNDDFVAKRSMSSGCASWAVASAVRLIGAFCSRSNVLQDKLLAFRRFEA